MAKKTQSWWQRWRQSRTWERIRWEDRNTEEDSGWNEDGIETPNDSNRKSKGKSYVLVTFLFCKRGTTTKVAHKRTGGLPAISEPEPMTMTVGSIAAGRKAWRWGRELTSAPQTWGGEWDRLGFWNLKAQPLFNKAAPPNPSLNSSNS